MEQKEIKQRNGHDAQPSGDSMTTQDTISAGDIYLHRRLAEAVEFTDVYRALRRHEAGEVQAELPQSLQELAQAESKSTGLVISYHIASNDLVFGVVTIPTAGESLVRLAPLDDLDELADGVSDGPERSVFV